MLLVPIGIEYTDGVSNVSDGPDGTEIPLPFLDEETAAMPSQSIVGRRFDTGQPVRLHWSGNRIERVEYLRSNQDALALPFLAPGLCDLQVNGCAGCEFASPDLESADVRTVADALLRMGVTRFCPTVTSHSHDVVAHALATIDQACRDDAELDRRVAGIHLEGPYISPIDGPRGAHPKEHVRPPDWNEFVRWQTRANNRIVMVTLSPEYPSAAEFIRRATAAGVIVALGHLAATREQIRAAVDAGASICTHLGNGAHPVLPRHPNYLWDQLAEDRLAAGLIADGFHLPEEVLKVFLRAKQPHRCFLVSDLAAQAELPPGRYRGGLCEVELLPEGKLVIADQRQLLAGAAAPLGAGIPRVMRVAGLTLAEAVRLACHQPRQIIGLAAAGLAPGDPAEFVLFHVDTSTTDNRQSFRIEQVVVEGRTMKAC